MVGLEGHAAVAPEGASRGRRIDPETGQLRIAQASAWFRFHLREKPGHTRRSLCVALQRPASPARPESRVQRRAWSRKEFDVLSLRRAHPAGWPAKDAGRGDADVEDAFE